MAATEPGAAAARASTLSPPVTGVTRRRRSLAHKARAPHLELTSSAPAGQGMQSQEPMGAPNVWGVGALQWPPVAEGPAAQLAEVPFPPSALTGVLAAGLNLGTDLGGDGRKGDGGDAEGCKEEKREGDREVQRAWGERMESAWPAAVETVSGPWQALTRSTEEGMKLRSWGQAGMALNERSKAAGCGAPAFGSVSVGDGEHGIGNTGMAWGESVGKGETDATEGGEDRGPWNGGQVQSEELVSTLERPECTNTAGEAMDWKEDQMGSGRRLGSKENVKGRVESRRSKRKRGKRAPSEGPLQQGSGPAGDQAESTALVGAGPEEGGSVGQLQGVEKKARGKLRGGLERGEAERRGVQGSGSDGKGQSGFEVEPSGGRRVGEEGVGSGGPQGGSTHVMPGTGLCEAGERGAEGQKHIEQAGLWDKSESGHAVAREVLESSMTARECCLNAETSQQQPRGTGNGKEMEGGEAASPLLSLSKGMARSMDAYWRDAATGDGAAGLAMGDVTEGEQDGVGERAGHGPGHGLAWGGRREGTLPRSPLQVEADRREVAGESHGGERAPRHGSMERQQEWAEQGQAEDHLAQARTGQVGMELEEDKSKVGREQRTVAPRGEGEDQGGELDRVAEPRANSESRVGDRLQASMVSSRRIDTQLVQDREVLMDGRQVNNVLVSASGNEDEEEVQLDTGIKQLAGVDKGGVQNGGQEVEGQVHGEGGGMAWDMEGDLDGGRSNGQAVAETLTSSGTVRRVATGSRVTGGEEEARSSTPTAAEGAHGTAVQIKAGLPGPGLANKPEGLGTGEVNGRLKSGTPTRGAHIPPSGKRASREAAQEGRGEEAEARPAQARRTEGLAAEELLAQRAKRAKKNAQGQLAGDVKSPGGRKRGAADMSGASRAKHDGVAANGSGRKAVAQEPRRWETHGPEDGHGLEWRAGLGLAGPVTSSLHVAAAVAAESEGRECEGMVVVAEGHGREGVEEKLAKEGEVGEAHRGQTRARVEEGKGADEARRSGTGKREIGAASSQLQGAAEGVREEGGCGGKERRQEETAERKADKREISDQDRNIEQVRMEQNRPTDKGGGGVNGTAGVVSQQQDNGDDDVSGQLEKDPKGDLGQCRAVASERPRVENLKESPPSAGNEGGGRGGERPATASGEEGRSRHLAADPRHPGEKGEWTEKQQAAALRYLRMFRGRNGLELPLGTRVAFQGRGKKGHERWEGPVESVSRWKKYGVRVESQGALKWAANRDHLEVLALPPHCQLSAQDFLPAKWSGMSAAAINAAAAAGRRGKSTRAAEAGIQTPPRSERSPGSKRSQFGGGPPGRGQDPEARRVTRRQARAVDEGGKGPSHKEKSGKGLKLRGKIRADVKGMKKLAPVDEDGGIAEEMEVEEEHKSCEDEVRSEDGDEEEKDGPDQLAELTRILVAGLTDPEEEARAKTVLWQLLRIDLTLAQVQRRGTWHAVSALQQHPNPHMGTRATALLDHWRGLQQGLAGGRSETVR